MLGIGYMARVTLGEPRIELPKSKFIILITQRSCELIFKH